MDKSPVTLQINVCIADIPYLETLTLRLIRRHRSLVAKVFIVADLCRPQLTQHFDPDQSSISQSFETKGRQLLSTIQTWLEQGLVDSILPFRSDDPAVVTWNEKFTGLPLPQTHDGLGHAFTAYWAGFAESTTRYVLHCDADIIFSHRTDTNWLNAAIRTIESDESIIGVSPPVVPPGWSESTPASTHSSHCDWLSIWESIVCPGGWKSKWISTRCLLVDTERLTSLLPLLDSKMISRTRWDEKIHQFLRRTPVARITQIFAATSCPRSEDRKSRRIINRIKHRWLPLFPKPPEDLLHEKLKKTALWVHYLRSDAIWMTHPTTKPPEFVKRLPDLLRLIDHHPVPVAQIGRTEFQWKQWLSNR